MGLKQMIELLQRMKSG